MLTHTQESALGVIHIESGFSGVERIIQRLDVVSVTYDDGLVVHIIDNEYCTRSDGTEGEVAGILAGEQYEEIDITERMRDAYQSRIGA